jgi:hypothetical protein
MSGRSQPISSLPAWRYIIDPMVLTPREVLK